MNFQLEIAARTVWMEARGEGLAGIVAVAWVIVNRSRSGRWFAGNNSIAGCCLFPQQFSCWNTADVNRQAMAVLPDEDPLLVACRTAVANALAGRSLDPTRGATHYHDVRMTSPPAWAVGRVPTCQIGHHVFFAGVP